MNKKENSVKSDDVLDELTQKLGTLEALLDNLDKRKSDEPGNPFRTVNNTHEQDSLDEISSLSGLSSSIASSIQPTVNNPARTLVYEPDSLDSDSESSSTSEEVAVVASGSYDIRQLETPPAEESPDESPEENVPEPAPLTQKDDKRDTLAQDEMRPRAKRSDTRREKIPTPIAEELGNDGDESEETVSIRNIQFMDNSEHLVHDVLDFMAKSKEYDNEIKLLESDLSEYTEVEKRIQLHLDKVSEWAKVERSKRTSLRKRVEQTIQNLEHQKTHIVGLEQQVERARNELEEMRAPSAWLYFAIGILLIILVYWGVDVHYPLSYV